MIDANDSPSIPIENGIIMTDMPKNGEVHDEKRLSTREKKKRARKALLLFLKNMKRSCSMYGTAQDWYSETKRLKSILEQFSDVLSKEQSAKLNTAMEPLDLTNKGISMTCKILKKDVKSIAKKFPMMGTGSAVLVKGLVTVAVIAGISSIFWQVSKVKLTVVNQGCSNIPVARGVPTDVTKLLKTLGMKLPLWIATNGSETFFVPPVTLSIDALQDPLAIEFLGQNAHITLPSHVKSITFNGDELIGKASDIQLRTQRAHTAVVTCAF